MCPCLVGLVTTGDDKMKNLLIDIDGVICQYDFARLTKQYFGVEVPNTDVFTYSLEDSLGLPRKAVSDMFAKEVFAEPNLIPGAVRHLELFLGKGYAINIYSNRLYWMTQEELGDWLDKWGIPYTDVINGGQLPSYIHAYVDDSPSKLLGVDEQTVVKHLILFTSPWNKHCLDILGKFERAKNWNEIRRIIG